MAVACQPEQFQLWEGAGAAGAWWALPAGFAGGRAVGEHAFPRVPVTAHMQQGKGTFDLRCLSWRGTKLLENEDSSLCASVFTFLAFCGIQVPDTLDLGCCSRAQVGGVGS